MLVSSVLIIGFFVVAAVATFTVIKRNTESVTKSTVEFVENRLECANIDITAEQFFTCAKINVTNDGTLSIDKLVLRKSNNRDVEVIPIIQQESKEFGCNDKKYIVQCPNLELNTRIITLESSLKPYEQIEIILGEITSIENADTLDGWHWSNRGRPNEQGIKEYIDERLLFTI